MVMMATPLMLRCQWTCLATCCMRWEQAAGATAKWAVRSIVGLQSAWQHGMIAIEYYAACDGSRQQERQQNGERVGMCSKGL